MVLIRLLTTRIRGWQTFYRDQVHQKQKRFLLVRERRDRGLHPSSWYRHCSFIKKHGSDLQCRKGTQDNIPHEEQRKIALISGFQGQT